MESFKNIWDSCLEIIKDNVGDNAFHTWFAPIVPIKYKGNDFTVQVPSHFFYEYLEEHYAELIYASLKRVAGKNLILYYSVIVDNTDVKGGKTIVQGDPRGVNDEEKKTVINLNKSPGSAIIPPAKWNANLNSKYTFHNFFEGESNLMARRIGKSVSEKLAEQFNPLYIYGIPGVGKTHLCHAVGNRITELFPEKKVMYISSHLFQIQFTDASRNNNSNDFMHFYQGVDVLIVDDIQEFAGKEKTQNAYFHIFNHLRLLGKHIILTSDKAPMELQGIEERLTSRFKSGAMIELSAPDIELRKKILQYKIKQDGLKISDEIVDYIAENVTEHIRDLEGIITSLVAHSLVYSRDIDLELAKRVISKAVKIEKRNITVDKIQNVVSNYFNVELKDIHSKTRKREIVQARHITMFLSKKYTDFSYSHIGSLIGKRDHATVLHACHTIQDCLDIDKSFRIKMSDIENLLKK